MKFFFTYLFLTAVVAFYANGQNIARKINFRTIEKDSLDLSLDANYYLIEDSCAQIVRHARFNFDTRKFHGKFSDVSKQNPSIILTEGNYSTEGLKEGPFIVRYPGGSIEAKGNFKNDKFDGRWEFFYEDEKPKLVFEVKDGVCNIIDEWNADGSKIIDKGNGNYICDLTTYYWKGKLVNGKPDGTWKMYASKDESKTAIATERFKKGEFTGGENQIGSYTGSSRIDLTGSMNLPFFNTEKLFVGPPCGVSVPQHSFTHAQYKAGNNTFNYDVQNALTTYFNGRDLDGVQGEFFVTGDISTDGHIINLTKGGNYVQSIADGVIGVIARLPRLNPAMLNGEPVVERFKITLNISKGFYSYSFQFIPIMGKY